MFTPALEFHSIFYGYSCYRRKEFSAFFFLFNPPLPPSLPPKHLVLCIEWPIAESGFPSVSYQDSSNCLSGVALRTYLCIWRWVEFQASSLINWVFIVTEWILVLLWSWERVGERHWFVRIFPAIYFNFLLWDTSNITQVGDIVQWALTYPAPR